LAAEQLAWHDLVRQKAVYRCVFFWHEHFLFGLYGQVSIGCTVFLLYFPSSGDTHIPVR
jgi:hypothetical protein